MKRIALFVTVLFSMLAGSLTVIVAPWAAAAAQPPSGLRGDYFGDPNLANLAFSRIDPIISFNWQTTAAGPGVGPDNFSVRWTGQVIPRYSETYTFYTRSDDGVRLWVNGQL